MFKCSCDEDLHGHGISIAPDQMKAMLADMDFIGIGPAQWHNAILLHRHLLPNAGAHKLRGPVQVAML